MKIFPETILLLLCGVVYAVTDEVKITVMEGDSVTLNTNLTELKTDGDKIRWRFVEGPDSKPLLVDVFNNKIEYSDTKFKSRLHISQIGSLSIKNMKNTFSGLYTAEIEVGSGSPIKEFRVTVYDAPRVIGAGSGDVKSVSVNERKSVTLHTGVQTHTDDLILWRFGDEGLLIAKGDKEDNKSSIYDDEGFRGRLKLDDQTGSLIISDVRSSDSGLYQLKISSNNRQTLYKTFSVSVSVYISAGLSAGEIAGIVVCVLMAVAAAVAAVVIYYRHKISKLKTSQQEDWPVPVFQSDDLVLPRDLKDIHTVNEGEWWFRDEVIIAKFNKKNNTYDTYDNVLDERFKDRLVLNHQTGFLTIKNMETNHSGLYTLKTSGALGPSQVHYNVIVLGSEISVVLGGSVTLETDVTDINTDDEIVWTFGPEDTRIARITGGTEHYLHPDERFRDRLKLNDQTGDLTITNITTEHTGAYKVQIFRSGKTRYKKFTVYIAGKNSQDESAYVNTRLLNDANSAV